MAILPIRLYPDPVLRQTCREVDAFDDDLRRLARDMVETMHAAPGIGLAAPQVGRPLRLALVDTSVGEDPEALLILVNPRITERQGRDTEVEGCLSLPGLTDKVDRPTGIRVEFHTVDGEERAIEAEGLTARAICHEVDHLDGVLFVDHLRGLRRERMRRKLKKFAQTAEVTV